MEGSARVGKRGFRFNSILTACTMIKIAAKMREDKHREFSLQLIRFVVVERLGFAQNTDELIVHAFLDFRIAGEKVYHPGEN